MKQDYKYITKNGEKVFTKPGENGPDDMVIYSEFPKQPWKHSLEYIGICLRLKSMVESRNYDKSRYAGEARLWKFCDMCIHNLSKTIKEICKELKVPGF
jgi:hypothetical protein